MVSGPGKAARSWHCSRAALLVSQSLDKRLSWFERVQLALHLGLYRLWTGPQKELAWIRRLLRHDIEDGVGHTPSGLSDEARQRIKNVLRDFLKNQGADPGAEDRRSFE